MSLEKRYGKAKSPPWSTAEVEALAEQVCEAVEEGMVSLKPKKKRPAKNLHRRTVVEGHLFEAEREDEGDGSEQVVASLQEVDRP